VSPTSNSSLRGWSPIKMPIKKRSQDLSPRRRNGIMGPDTRQRAALIGHLLSLHHSSEGSHGTHPVLCPSPEPETNWRARTSARPPDSLLNGTVMRVRMCF